MSSGSTSWTPGMAQCPSLWLPSLTGACVWELGWELTRCWLCLRASVLGVCVAVGRLLICMSRWIGEALGDFPL